MSSYWRAGGKITLDQTDVEISAENGLQFSMDGQEIGIYIPPSIKYFSGKDSLLSFDVELGADTNGGWQPTRLMLDSLIGGQSLFSKVQIFAGNRAQLLEETDDYNTHVAVKYSYETNDTLRNKRALVEGCGAWIPSCRGTMGTVQSHQSNCLSNPFFKKRGDGEAVGGIDDTTAFTNAGTFIKAHVELPLHMGVFANNSKAFPNVLTDGVYISLTTAPSRQVFRTLDTVCQSRSLLNCPQFGGATTHGTQWTHADGGVSAFFCTHKNVQINAQVCPFIVGEEVGLVKNDGTKVETDVAMVISGIKSVATGWEITTSAPITLVSPDPVNKDGDFHWVSLSLDPKTAPTTVWSPSLVISDVKMIVHKVDVGQQYEQGMMSKMKQGGAIEFDLPCVQCHKNSILKTDRQATLNINIEHAKAKSIICVPTDATIVSCSDNANSKNTYNWGGDDDPLGDTVLEDDIRIRSDQTGLVGMGNFLTSYNFQLNGQLVPTRAVACSKSSSKNGGIDGTQILELEKALMGAGHEPMSFASYRKNFCIGRVLAMDENTVYDGRGVDTRLLLRYEETTGGAKVGGSANNGAPERNTLWKNFVYHIKTISIKGDGITVLN